MWRPFVRESLESQKNGVAVPQHNMSLPKGFRVEIHVRPEDEITEREAELNQSDEANDEARTPSDELDKLTGSSQ